LKKGYCGVECQKQDWLDHKPNCRIYTMQKKSIDRLLSVIKGNLLIMRAWYGNSIDVNINESLQDFMSSEMHFLKLSASAATSTATTDAAIGTVSAATATTSADATIITFIFSDTTERRIFKSVLAASVIRSRHPKPTSEWTLVV
jgi:hypothetical protein